MSLARGMDSKLDWPSTTASDSEAIPNPRTAAAGRAAWSKLAIQAIHPANVLKTDGAHFLLGVIAQ
jgi:hypothetical protein